VASENAEMHLLFYTKIVIRRQKMQISMLYFLFILNLSPRERHY